MAHTVDLPMHLRAAVPAVEGLVPDLQSGGRLARVGDRVSGTHGGLLCDQSQASGACMNHYKHRWSPPSGWLAVPFRARLWTSLLKRWPHLGCIIGAIWMVLRRPPFWRLTCIPVLGRKRGGENAMTQ